ncbi:hypothetical protein [Ureibacillus manganicus]|uniref:Uncharacterized protein n=1 Tax=Ureibacillus manganicus DSM 26584 TaxID=1384049 RepID=A0A0A3HQX0_9BACL|nr:hypothetical protein [Ureibacillus manganicus]KGR73630.1 hypothetical protein CD29_19225 [Ureibacillus manganicus DSM 26584]
MLKFDEEAIYRARTEDRDFFNSELRIEVKEEGTGIYDDMHDLIIYTDCFIDFKNIQSIVFCNNFIPCVDQKRGFFKAHDGLYQIRLTEQFIVGKQHVVFLKFTFLMDSKMYKLMKDDNMKKRKEMLERKATETGNEKDE